MREKREIERDRIEEGEKQATDREAREGRERATGKIDGIRDSGRNRRGASGCRPAYLTIAHANRGRDRALRIVL